MATAVPVGMPGDWLTSKGIRYHYFIIIAREATRAKRCGAAAFMALCEQHNYTLKKFPLYRKLNLEEDCCIHMCNLFL